MHSHATDANSRHLGDAQLQPSQSTASSFVCTSATLQAARQIRPAYNDLLTAAGLVREDLSKGKGCVLAEEADGQSDLRQFQVQLGELIKVLDSAASQAGELQTSTDIRTLTDSGTEALRCQVKALKSRTLIALSSAVLPTRVLQQLEKAALKSIQDLRPLQELTSQRTAASTGRKQSIYEEEELKAALIQAKYQSRSIGERLAEARTHHQEKVERMADLRGRQDKNVDVVSLVNSLPSHAASAPTSTQDGDEVRRQRLEEISEEVALLRMDLAAVNSKVFVCCSIADTSAPSIIDQLYEAFPGLEQMVFESDGRVREVGGGYCWENARRQLMSMLGSTFSKFAECLHRQGRELSWDAACRNWCSYLREQGEGQRVVTVWLCDGFGVGSPERMVEEARKFFDEMNSFRGSATIGLTRSMVLDDFPTLERVMEAANGGQKVLPCRSKLSPLVRLEFQRERDTDSVSWVIPKVGELRQLSTQDTTSQTYIERKLKEKENQKRRLERRTQGADLVPLAAKECAAALAEAAMQDAEVRRAHFHAEARRCSQDISDRLRALEQEERHLQGRVDSYTMEKQELDEKTIPDFEAKLACLRRQHQARHHDEVDQQACLESPIAAANNFFEHVATTQSAYESLLRCCREALQVPAAADEKVWNLKAVEYYQKTLGIDVMNQREESEDARAKIVDHILSQLALVPELLELREVAQGFASSFCLADLCCVEPSKFQTLLSSPEDFYDFYKTQILEQQMCHLKDELAGLASLATLPDPGLLDV